MYGNVLTKDQIDSLLKTESVLDPIGDETWNGSKKPFLSYHLHEAWHILHCKKMKTTGGTFEHMN